MLKINYIGEFNPFDWEAFRCPVCGKSEFESVSHTGVFCVSCEVQFRVRYTCGDSGCVVDCFINPMPAGGSIYAPLWKCDDCGAKTAILDWQEHVCSVDHTHTKLSRIKRVHGVWTIPKNFPSYFYLILKRGDYCSGWIRGNSSDLSSLDYPTQEEWDKFQKEHLTKKKGESDGVDKFE